MYSVVWACLREDSLRLTGTRQPHLACSDEQQAASAISEHAPRAQKTMKIKQQKHSTVTASIRFASWAQDGQQKS
jgi:hypothetical protein